MIHDQFATGIPNSRRCDESKCVSKGMSNLHNSSLTCYGDDGVHYPMMCADGFLPMVVENEPPRFATGVDGSEDIPVWYFTCCPPDYVSPETTVDATKHYSDPTITRHCSDPITTPTDFEADIEESLDGVCDNHDTRKYPRQMKSNVESTFTKVLKTDSYICCDNNNTNTDDFLDDLECVPYRNKFYESFRIQNEIGWIKAISCDLPDGTFGFPRPIDGTNNDFASTGRYQCCKSGPAMPPFVQDSEFEITVYPLVAIWCVSAVVSIIVAIGLLIPLLIKRKQGITETETSRWRSSINFNPSTSSITSARRGSSSINIISSAPGNPPSLVGSSQRRDLSIASSSNSQRSQRKGLRRGEPRYSTYNVYLIYLAVIDVLFALSQIYWYGRYINQQFSPRFYSTLVSSSSIFYSSICLEAAIAYSYLFANLMINSIIAYQVVVLLQNSRRGLKTNQPSLRTVNLHGGAVCVLSIIYGSILFLLREASRKGFEDCDFESIGTVYFLPIVLVAVVLFPPIGYVIYVTAKILIWKRSFAPSGATHAGRARAMKELAFYFIRIVTVFVAIWIPVNVLSIYAAATWKWWALVVGQCLGATQPILTFCMILTKSDARNYIWDLVTLSYLFGNWNCRKVNASPMEENKTTEEREMTNTFRTEIGSSALCGMSSGFCNTSISDQADKDGSSALCSISSAFCTTSTSDKADNGSGGDEEDAITITVSDASIDADINGDGETGENLFSSRRVRDRRNALISIGEMVSVRSFSGDAGVNQIKSNGPIDSNQSSQVEDGTSVV